MCLENVFSLFCLISYQKKKNSIFDPKKWNFGQKVILQALCTCCYNSLEQIYTFVIFYTFHCLIFIPTFHWLVSCIQILACIVVVSHSVTLWKLIDHLQIFPTYFLKTEVQTCHQSFNYIGLQNIEDFLCTYRHHRYHLAADISL